MEDPQFMIYVGLDGPKPVEGTYGFATGGWNAAPTVKKMLCRIAPILGYVVDPTAVENEGRQTNLMPVNQSIEVSDETE